MNGGRDVSVSPWDRGAEPPMAPGYASLVLEDPSGSVIIWSRNLTRADLLAVAEGMTLREDGQPGWHLKNVPPGLTPIHEGWGLGAASRFARWSGAGLEMELTIVHGVSAMFTNLPGIGSTAFVDIRGARGVAYDLDDRSAVVWSPAPDLVVLLGLYGPVETAIELARSSVPVDEATWLAATTSAPAGQDGCNSMFC